MNVDNPVDTKRLFWIRFYPSKIDLHCVFVANVFYRQEKTIQLRLGIATKPLLTCQVFASKLSVWTLCYPTMVSLFVWCNLLIFSENNPHWTLVKALVLFHHKILDFLYNIWVFPMKHHVFFPWKSKFPLKHYFFAWVSQWNPVIAFIKSTVFLVNVFSASKNVDP